MTEKKNYVYCLTVVREHNTDTVNFIYEKFDSNSLNYLPTYSSASSKYYIERFHCKTLEERAHKMQYFISLYHVSKSTIYSREQILEAFKNNPQIYYSIQ